MLNYNIVLIADRLYNDKNLMNMESNQLEKIDDKYFNHIYGTLRRIAPKITHYDNLKDFIDNIHKHKNDIVFTIYGGTASRNRMALVPAICEAYSIKFVGADVYNRVICQDKQLSKDIARRNGLKTPFSITVNNQEVLNNLNLSNLPFPVVVKPLFEGSSIGITEKSLCNSKEEVKLMVSNELELYKQPILIEEFIPGKEVVTCIIGNKHTIKLCEVVERYDLHDENYFSTHLFTGKEKFILREHIKERVITDTLNQDTIVTFKNIFKNFEKMDYMRIDGRIKDNEFYFIEFTPDASLSVNNPFQFIYSLNNKTYDDVLYDIIQSSLENY